MGNNFYRSRVDIPLSEKARKFISSFKEDFWIIEEDVIGTEVHDIMLYEEGFLSRIEIVKILQSLESVKEEVMKNNIEIDESFEDIHPFIEKKVIDDIGIEIGGKIHTGRSRNDQISVDLRLKIRKELNLVSKELLTLSDILIDLSKKNVNTFMPLYTHLQKAQLGVFSHYLNNYVIQIIRSLERIEEIYGRVNNNPLGGCAIGGTNIGINRLRTTELLGFDDIIYNSIDAISSKDYILETLMGLSLLATHFSRIAEDLMIWSTKEFDFIELDDKFCSVSSVMPQKKNPDTIELIRSKCSKVISTLFSSMMITKSVPTGYFRDFQDLKVELKNSFDLIVSIIEMFKEIFSTLKVKKQNMKENIDESFIIALDLAELLVQEYNIPFRLSHQIVAKLVKNSKNPEDILNLVKIEDFVFKVWRKEISLSKNAIEDLKNLDLCLEKRISQGSPSKKEVTLFLEMLDKNKESLKILYKERILKLERADALRDKLIKDLLV